MSHAEIECTEIDTLAVTRLLEHVEELNWQQENREEYEKHATAQRQERLTKVKQIEKSINDIDRDQSGLTRSLGKLEGEIEQAEQERDEAKKELKERRKALIEREIDTLEIERRRLIKTKQQLEKEAEEDIGALEDELIRLKEGWNDYTFGKRRSLINFTIVEVVVDVMSTHWMRIEISWLHEEWPREEMYYHREWGTVKGWSEEETAIMQEHYTIMPKSQLMALLPNRGWNAILNQAQTQGLSKPMGRPKGETVGGDRRSSYADIQFMRKEGIPDYTDYTKWKTLSAR